jgi:hypothetical protein
VQDQEAAWTSWELKFRAGWPDSGFVGSAFREMKEKKQSRFALLDASFRL